MLLDRLTSRGMETSEYFIPEGEFNLISQDSSISLPNCTQYCFLESHEATNANERHSTWFRATGGFGTAKNWFRDTTLPKGYELRENSIGVFDGNSGHVIFINRVIDATHADITHSQYDDDKSRRDYKYFQRIDNQELIVGQATMAGVGALIGYIYLPMDEDIRKSRDVTKEQVEVTETFVNIRKAAGTDKPVFREGCFAKPGLYNVLAKEEVNGITWFKLDEDCWISDGRWINHYPKEKDTDKELVEQIKELKAQVKSLESENSKMKKALDKINELSNY